MTPEQAAFVVYARAWVALHAKGAGEWTDADAVAAYHLLPPPPVTLADWCSKMGLSGAPEPEAPQADIEAGPGWAAASTPEAAARIDAHIAALEKAAERLKHG